MATDLSLVVLGDRLHRGHMIDLLRDHEDSGFYERTPAIAEMNRRIMDKAQKSFSPIDTFPDGLMRGQRIDGYGTRMQALALAPRYKIATAEARAMVTRPQPFLTFIPFLLDAGAINGLTGYVAETVKDDESRAQIVTWADDFFVKHYGYFAFLCDD